MELIMRVNAVRSATLTDQKSLFVCTGAHSIEMRDADSLHLKRMLAVPDGVFLDDLAVTPSSDRVYTVGANQRGNLIIESYSAITGDSLNQTEVAAGFKYPSLSLVVARNDRWLAVTVKDPGDHKTRGAIVLCRLDVQPSDCKVVLQRDFVGQGAFLYNSFLFVSSVLATSSTSECIHSLNLSTMTVDARALCAKGQPAHYAMAVLGEDRVVAFTGYAKRNGYTENTTPVTNNLSVWSIEPKQMTALVEGTPSRFLQTQTQIIAATQGLERFLTFQQLSDTITLYQLSD
jgi:hypothetical protein